jgi:hypothetical protein
MQSPTPAKFHGNETTDIPLRIMSEGREVHALQCSLSILTQSFEDVCGRYAIRDSRFYNHARTELAACEVAESAKGNGSVVRALYRERPAQRMAHEVDVTFDREWLRQGKSLVRRPEESCDAGSKFVPMDYMREAGRF